MSDRKNIVTLSNTPFAPMLAAVVCGIVIGSLLPFWYICFIPVFGATLVYIYRVTTLKSPHRIVASAELARWQYMFLVVALGCMSATISHPGNPETDYDNFDFLQAEVTDIRHHETHTSYTIQAQRFINRADGSSKSAGKLNLLLYANDCNLRQGDVIEIPNNIKRIGDNLNFAEPTAETLFPTENAQYSVSGSKYDIRVIGNEFGSIRYLPLRIRHNILAKLQQSSLDTDAKNLIGTMLLADKESATQEMRRQFADAGIAHILAVSGLHVGIIAAIILALLSPLRLTRFRQQRYWIAILLVWVYTLICGMPVSAVRASIMITLCMLALMTEREYSALNALCAAAFLILVFSPFALFSASLQFSFVAVFSLVAILPFFNNIKRRYKVRHYVASAISASLVASVAGWGLTSYWFGRVPILFLPANLIVLPLLPVYMTVTIVYIALLYVGIDAAWLSGILNTGADGIISLAQYVAHSSASVIDLKISALPALFFFLAVLVAGLWLYSRRKLYAVSFAILAVSVPVAVLILPPMQSNATGFIVTDNPKTITIRHYDNGMDSLIAIESDTIRALQLHNRSILTVSMPIDKMPELDRCDMLIIGNGFKGSARQIFDIIDPEFVILTPGVYVYRARDIVEECTKRNIPCHNIADNGPFRVGKLPSAHVQL